MTGNEGGSFSVRFGASPGNHRRKKGQSKEDKHVPRTEGAQPLPGESLHLPADSLSFLPTSVPISRAAGLVVVTSGWGQPGRPTAGTQGRDQRGAPLAESQREEAKGKLLFNFSRFSRSDLQYLEKVFEDV